jgi:hypothetical protein
MGLTFAYDADAGPLEALRRQWFEATASMATFEQVLCVRVTGSDAAVARLPCAPNPYRHCLYAFYATRPVMAQVTLLGTLTYAALMAALDVADGTIRLSDLTSTSNLCLPVMWEDDDDDNNAVVVDDTPWIPVARLTPHLAAEAEFRLDTLHARIGWYTSEYLQLPREPDDAEDEYATCVLMPMVANWMAAYKWVGIQDTVAQASARFVKARLELERPRFMARFAAYARSERALLRLFLANRMRPWLLETCVVARLDDDAFASDFQCFHSRNAAMPPPRVLFQVPVETVPFHLHPLPVYRGGVARLSYCEMVEWLWHQVELETPIRQGPDRPADRRMHLEVRHALVYCSQHAHRRPGGSSNNKRPRVAQATAVADTVPIPLPSGIALESVVPPCLRHVMEAGHFPRYNEGRLLVGSLRHGNVDRDDAFAWLEQKHARFPHAKIHYATARDRFKYDWFWDNNAKPMTCRLLVENAVGGVGEHGACPYAVARGGATIVEDIEALRGACQQQCVAAMGDIGQGPFTGPYNLIRRKLWRLSGHSQQPSDAVAAKVLTQEEQQEGYAEPYATDDDEEEDEEDEER